VDISDPDLLKDQESGQTLDHIDVNKEKEDETNRVQEE